MHITYIVYNLHLERVAEKFNNYILTNVSVKKVLITLAYNLQLKELNNTISTDA